MLLFSVMDEPQLNRGGSYLLSYASTPISKSWIIHWSTSFNPLWKPLTLTESFQKALLVNLNFRLYFSRIVILHALAWNVLHVVCLRHSWLESLRDYNLQKKAHPFTCLSYCFSALCLGCAWLQHTCLQISGWTSSYYFICTP